MAVRLLMIDTDETFCRNVSQRLLLENYRVFVTADEAEARRIVHREKVDVVLLGLKEFKQRGLSLLESIKRIRPATQVILMLPAELLALSIEGMHLGAFDDLLMPFDMETLLTRIKAAGRCRPERGRTGKSLPRGRATASKTVSKEDAGGRDPGMVEEKSAGTLAASDGDRKSPGGDERC